MKKLILAVALMFTVVVVPAGAQQLRLDRYNMVGEYLSVPRSPDGRPEANLPPAAPRQRAARPGGRRSKTRRTPAGRSLDDLIRPLQERRRDRLPEHVFEVLDLPLKLTNTPVSRSGLRLANSFCFSSSISSSFVRFVPPAIRDLRRTRFTASPR
jgi:hypothetical protein